MCEFFFCWLFYYLFAGGRERFAMCTSSWTKVSTQKNNLSFFLTLFMSNIICTNKQTFMSFSYWDYFRFHVSCLLVLVFSFLFHQSIIFICHGYVTSTRLLGVSSSVELYKFFLKENWTMKKLNLIHIVGKEKKVILQKFIKH